MIFLTSSSPPSLSSLSDSANIPTQVIYGRQIAASLSPSSGGGGGDLLQQLAAASQPIPAPAAFGAPLFVEPPAGGGERPPNNISGPQLPNGGTNEEEESTALVSFTSSPSSAAAATSSTSATSSLPKFLSGATQDVVDEVALGISDIIVPYQTRRRCSRRFATASRPIAISRWFSSWGEYRLMFN